MEEAFQRDLYSGNFNALKNLGAWGLNSSNIKKERFFFAYRCFILACSNVGLILAMTQLYVSGRDLKKISFNLSTTILSGGILIKNFYLAYHSKEIDKFRLALFKDAWVQTDPAEIKIKERYRSIFFAFKKTLYVSAFTCLPVWLCFSLATLIWEPRELPFSMWMPLNLNDNIQYLLAFLYHSVMGLYVTTEAIHAELGFFGIVFQIIAQYEILAEKILSVNKYYELPETVKRNKNYKIIIEKQIQTSLKKCVQRHLKLNEYVKKLEFFYSETMLLQLGGCLAIGVVNGLEILGQFQNASIKWLYQICYTVIITGVVFMICYFADLLKKKRESLTAAIYEIAWYEMDYKLQKYLLLMLIGSQVEQPLTAWKLIQLDLNTFLGVVQAVVSWLTLFWQFMK